MVQHSLISSLKELQDPDYRAMQIRIIPNIPSEKIIGVRTPALRQLAKTIPQSDTFLDKLPHLYFEEDQLHIFVISACKDFETVITRVDSFLPYVDNWATCDQLNPKVFSKHHTELLSYIEKWIHADNPFSVRFAIKMLMDHFLEKDFSPVYLDKVASVQSDEYYVRMMIAWYFATAIAKQFDAAYPYLSQMRLETWIHNKTIQKSVESFRVSDDQKAQLRLLRK